MFELPTYVLYMLLVSCASTQTTTSTSAYTEDLSYLRPKFEETSSTSKSPSPTEKRKAEFVEPIFSVKKSLHAVLDSIDRINLAKKSIDGFCIQIYSGAKREDALQAKRTLDQNLPEMNAEMVYIQPTFRIKVGKYYNQLDAQKDFVQIKRYFPNAILIPTKINID